MNTTCVLDIRNLTIALPQGSDRVNAVTKVDLRVNRGEIVCLVGESGSGKSVIAHAVMGLSPKELKATGGEILLEGEDILKATPERLRALRCVRMSMIFQEPMTALNPVMRCDAQIDEVLAMHTQLPAAERHARVKRIIEDSQPPGVGLALLVAVQADDTPAGIVAAAVFEIVQPETGERDQPPLFVEIDADAELRQRGEAQPGDLAAPEADADPEGRGENKAMRLDFTIGPGRAAARFY